MIKCPACNGKGYLEFEHGLIRVPCNKCKGIGEVRKEVNGKRELSEETKQKIRESMKGNKNRKNGKWKTKTS